MRHRFEHDVDASDDRSAGLTVASPLELVGLDWPVPDDSTPCRRQKTLAVQLPCHGRGGPLHLPIDGTGIKVRGEGEWHARKHGGAKRRVWRKVHLAIDEASMDVRAIEVTDSRIGDAPMMPGLPSRVPGDESTAFGEPLGERRWCV